MEPHSTNFGARLRGLLEKGPGSHLDFIAHIGISEATLYNWLKQLRPPHEKYWPKMAKYFGVTVDYLAHGTPQKIESALEEEQALYGDDKMIEQEVRRYFEHVLIRAKGEPSRLGWLLEQLRTHLVVPAHWTDMASVRAELPLHFPITGAQLATAKEHLAEVHQKNVKKLVHGQPPDPAK